MKSTIIIEIESGRKGEVNLSLLGQVNDPRHHSYVQALRVCLAEELPKRLGGKCATQASSSDSPETAKLRTSMMALVQRGGRSEYNNGVLDCVNLLPKT